MGISEHEGLWLFKHESIKRFEIFSEIRLFVTTDQIDREQAIACSESGQLSERLLTRSTEANKKGTTLWEPYDSMYLDSVFQGIVEED